MTKRTDAEIEAAAKRLEKLLDELDPATGATGAATIRMPPRKNRRNTGAATRPGPSR